MRGKGKNRHVFDCSENSFMKTTRWLLLAMVLILTPFAHAQNAAGRERLLFNDGWRFARFGVLSELGRPANAFSASSEQTNQGNTAGKAFDGDLKTRWCAAGVAGDQWLQADLGRSAHVGAVELKWELPLAYQYKLATSADGLMWKTVVDRTQNRDVADSSKLEVNADARFLRLTVTEVPDKKWASVREFRALDTAGGVISPATPDATAKATLPDDPTFNDAGWRKLNLPHDWAIEGPFKFEFPGETGKLQYWGVGWYRKHFAVADADTGRQIYLDVDGAMSHATVWVNGHSVGGWPYGYASWRVDLTPFVKFGEENVLAIRLNNPEMSSRWYPGAGIYRNVWLVKTAPVHVGQWGVCVTTPKISKEAATVNLQVTVENSSAAEASVKVGTKIFAVDADGKKTGEALATVAPISLKVAAKNNATTPLAADLPNPKLWNLKTPHRYVAVTTVAQEGKVVDTVKTAFGIRTIEFTADNGFLLNGERVKINGVCNHHDLGALGAAINIRALRRQIELLQEMGCNAIRTSHNPPAPELLDLCDRLGMLVMDEAFDAWTKAKKKNDYTTLFPEWHEKDVRAMVRRDRNHPCVILWSIGNEISESRKPEGQSLAAELASVVHSEDATRYVTAGCNAAESATNGFQKKLDVLGCNYKSMSYGAFHEANPGLPIIASETASAFSSRGEYFFPVTADKKDCIANFQVSSYDSFAPTWGTRAEGEFKGQEMFPFVAGEFVWTGFDYLGEPTPFNKDLSNLLNVSNAKEKARLKKELQELGKIQIPSRSSYYGILDLAGFKKDRYFLYQSHWRPDFPMAHIFPHWNWPERVGLVTPVHVYTSGDEAELFLNGKSLGRKKKAQYEYRLRWDDVKYAPGELKVVVYKNGKEWAQESVKTASAAAKVTLQPDRAVIRADALDLSYVTVTIADKDGLLVPRSKNYLKFEISGPGKILAVDNGDATSFEPFQASERNAFNGLALVIVQSTKEAGRVVLKAVSDGLESAKAEINTEAKAH